MRVGGGGGGGTLKAYVRGRALLRVTVLLYGTERARERVVVTRRTLGDV